MLLRHPKNKETTPTNDDINSENTAILTNIESFSRSISIVPFAMFPNFVFNYINSEQYYNIFVNCTITINKNWRTTIYKSNYDDFDYPSTAFRAG